MLFKAKPHYILVLQKGNYLHGRNVNYWKRKTEHNVRKYNYPCNVYNTRKYVWKHILIYSFKAISKIAFVSVLSVIDEKMQTHRKDDVVCIYIRILVSNAISKSDNVRVV